MFVSTICGPTGGTFGAMFRPINPIPALLFFPVGELRSWKDSCFFFAFKLCIVYMYLIYIGIHNFSAIFYFRVNHFQQIFAGYSPVSGGGSGWLRFTTTMLHPCQPFLEGKVENVFFHVVWVYMVYHMCLNCLTGSLTFWNRCLPTKSKLAP